MPASAPLVPVRPAPRSLKPSPGPLEIFADGLAIEIRRDDRVLYDSPLEEAGFEPSGRCRRGRSPDASAARSLPIMYAPPLFPARTRRLEKIDSSLINPA